VQELMEENFTIIYPPQEIHVARDEDDNRVLEAAVTGHCHYVITGDFDLLALGIFKNITIVKPDTFLAIIMEQQP
jgi:predicted nucleic acid-binding protein